MTVSTQAPISQTLSRGLTALEILAAADRPLSLNDLAARLGVHRSNAYRLLRTLEHHRFVLRDDRGHIRLGAKMAVIARGVTPQLHAAAVRPITDLANSIGMTVFLNVLDADEVIAVTSIEPTTVDVSVSRRPGSRHHILQGAPGHVLESLLSPDDLDELLGTREYSPPAKRAQELGYAVSSAEVIDGVAAIAVPLTIEGEPLAALAIAHFTMPEELESLAGQLHLTAARIAQNYQ